MEDQRQIVLITGCSQGGIGHALAREFASKGCLVVATSRSKKTMQDLEHDTSRFCVMELDVVSDESVKNVVENVIQKFGRIDILVNNAGVQCVGPLAEIPLASVQNTFNTNVFGPLRMIQAVVPHMAARRRGKIINMGSIGTAFPAPWAATYTATKSTIHSLTDTLRLELSHFGIHVTLVVPGAIKSNIANSAVASYQSMPEWKLYKPFEEIIKERAYLSQTPKSTPADVFARDTVAVLLREKPPAWFTTGQFSTIMAIMYHMPNFIKDFVARRTMKC
ncbi:short-chain dehydrogenase RED1-like [Mangifera indica]|uniref:short-chain dehydrogenase RED1-like n=1 Tax=Mangifera indica TaxID=29780 RepID=UPI001CFAC88A|nr:short-chain dehydrogenase RED1-like [Mangifera indica]XP_044469583.1 short-chain dehydrogenase RED1-like [Mangifera indica]